MIRLYSLYKSSHLGMIKSDITHFCKSIVWSGDVDQFARKLEVTMAYSIWDKNHDKVQIGPGTVVWVTIDGKELFRGTVFDRTITSSSQELKFEAYDYLMYFTKSKGYYNFTKITPEEVAKTICDNIGIGTGDIVKTGLPVTFLAKGKVLLEIILQAYTMAYKQNNINYMPFMQGTNFAMRVMGDVVENYVITPITNTNNVQYEDTINNMINRVVMYNSDGTSSILEVAAWRKDFGTLQDIVEAEEGKDLNTEAQNLLHSIDITCSIDAIGNFNCISGKAVQIKIPYIEMLQDIKMYIISDSHTFDVATDMHTMELTVSMENKMKTIEGD